MNSSDSPGGRSPDGHSSAQGTDSGERRAEAPGTGGAGGVPGSGGPSGGPSGSPSGGADAEAARSLRAFAHPLRLRLLSLLTGAAMSAAEAARETGETQANVSYHLRRLHAAGLVQVAEEVAVRGGRARRYRHDPESGPRTSGTDTDRRMVDAALAEEIVRRGALRDPAGGARHFTDLEVWMDPAEWRRLTDRAGELGAELHAAARPPRAPGAVRVSASMLFFGMADPGPPAGHAGAAGPEGAEAPSADPGDGPEAGDGTA